MKLKLYENFDENLTLDDIYDDLSQEQRNYIDQLLAGGNTIKGIYHDVYYRNGGWNGMMDAISDYQKQHKIKDVDLDVDGDVDVMDLVVKAMSE